MSALVQDLRFGARSLAKRPGFTLAAVLTLALGIGANTAIFSVVHGVLLESLPYAGAERLVAIPSNQSLPELEEIRAANDALASVGGIVVQVQDLTGRGEPVQVEAGLVTGDLFGLFGAKAHLGRPLAPEDDRLGGERVAVLGHGFWQRHFGADPGIVGRTIDLSGHAYTVVGVMPAGFRLPLEDPELYAPVQVVNPVAAPRRGVHFLRFYAALRPDASLAQAQASLDAVNARMEREFPEESSGRIESERQRLVPLRERLVGDVRPAVLLLFGAVGFVLLIACANFANLLLARAVTRQAELAIRSALGAGRVRLVRQLLTESVLLSALGGLVGLVLARWGVDALLALRPDAIPGVATIEIDAPVLAFAAALSLATGVVFGLVPAAGAISYDLGAALKEGDRRTGTPRRRLHDALIVSEVALALVLMVGAGLLVKSVVGLASVDPGFDPSGLVTMRIELPEARYEATAEQARFRTRLLDELNAQPGVEAAMVSELPLAGSSLDHDFLVEGAAPVPPGQEPSVYTRSVAGDYFRVMRIPVLAGRDFNAGDVAEAPLVAVANEALVRRYFPDRDPLGARVRWARAEGEPQWITIVGVARDVRHFGLGRSEAPALYTPYAQATMAWKRWMCLAVRSSGEPAAAAGLVKGVTWGLDPQLPITRIRTMDEIVAASLGYERFVTSLLLLFAATAVALAAAGIYGVVSYAVAARTREFGVRLAVGASARDVFLLVLGRGAALAGVGAALGVAGALLLARLLEGWLFGVDAVDPLVVASVAALLVAIALVACFVPALRASRVDPLVALRYE